MGKDKMRTGQQTRDKRLVPPDPKQQALPELRGLPRVPVRLRRTPKKTGCARAEPHQSLGSDAGRACVRACVRARSRQRRRSGEARAGDRAGIGPRAGAVREAPSGSWGRGRSPGGRDWSRARERGGRSQGPGLGGGAALRRRGGAGTPAAVPPPSRTSCGTSARASPPER